MLTDVTRVVEPPTTPPPDDTWGSLRRFQHLTGADDTDGLYWLRVVHRPAHRVSHPQFSVTGCPGCVFENTVAR